MDSEDEEELVDSELLLLEELELVDSDEDEDEVDSELELELVDSLELELDVDSDEDEEAAFWMDFKGSGIYRDTDAVVSIEFRPANGVFYNFESGSKFSLYGTGKAS